MPACPATASSAARANCCGNRGSRGLLAKPFAIQRLLAAKVEALPAGGHDPRSAPLPEPAMIFPRRDPAAPTRTRVKICGTDPPGRRRAGGGAGCGRPGPELPSRARRAVSIPGARRGVAARRCPRGSAPRMAVVVNPDAGADLRAAVGRGAWRTPCSSTATRTRRFASRCCAEEGIPFAKAIRVRDATSLRKAGALPHRRIWCSTRIQSRRLRRHRAHPLDWALAARFRRAGARPGPPHDPLGRSAAGERRGGDPAACVPSGSTWPAGWRAGKAPGARTRRENAGILSRRSVPPMVRRGRCDRGRNGRIQSGIRNWAPAEMPWAEKIVPENSRFTERNRIGGWFASCFGRLVAHHIP